MFMGRIELLTISNPLLRVHPAHPPHRLHTLDGMALVEVSDPFGIRQVRFGILVDDGHSALPRALSEADVREALEQLDPLWEELFPAEQARVIELLVERIDVAPVGADHLADVLPMGVDLKEGPLGRVGLPDEDLVRVVDHLPDEVVQEWERFFAA